jgi:hypothetical protein
MGEWSFEDLAASFRADSRDLVTFHEVLAKKLEEALPPGSVRVHRGGWPLGGNRPLTQLTIDLEDNSFQMEHTARGYEYRLAKVVRGIALKTASTSFPEWLDALTQALWVEANRSDQTREALERFLMDER